jgi:Rieske Fe-S protein
MTMEVQLMNSEPSAAVRGTATRRALFATAGAVGAGAVLAACGGDSDGLTGDGPPPRSDTGTRDPGNNSTEGDDGSNGDEGSEALAGVGEIEVGGGVINAAENVVVTQPAQGDFRGFSASCTHQACQVSSVSDGVINCACHGSQYSIEDGSVVRAAPGLTTDTQNPLSEVAVTVEGQSVVRA